MKKKILLAVVVMLLAATVTGFVYAESKIQLETELVFTGATDDRVILKVSNQGRKPVQIGAEAYYMDEIGSAGSWNCAAAEQVRVWPGRSYCIEFEIEKAVTHGDNSILAFFFQHEGTWYLAKTGVNQGFEYFEQHN